MAYQKQLGLNTIQRPWRRPWRLTMQPWQQQQPFLRPRLMSPQPQL
jgi:hypothetical protein